MFKGDALIEKFRDDYIEDRSGKSFGTDVYLFENARVSPVSKLLGVLKGIGFSRPHPRSVPFSIPLAPGSGRKGELQRLEPASKRLMVYTSLRCSLVKPRKSSRDDRL